MIWACPQMGDGPHFMAFQKAIFTLIAEMTRLGPSMLAVHHAIFTSILWCCFNSTLSYAEAWIKPCNPYVSSPSSPVLSMATGPRSGRASLEWSHDATRCRWAPQDALDGQPFGPRFSLVPFWDFGLRDLELFLSSSWPFSALVCRGLAFIRSIRAPFFPPVGRDCFFLACWVQFFFLSTGCPFHPTLSFAGKSMGKEWKIRGKVEKACMVFIPKKLSWKKVPSITCARSGDTLPRWFTNSYKGCLVNHHV